MVNHFQKFGVPNGDNSGTPKYLPDLSLKGKREMSVVILP